MSKHTPHTRWYDVFHTAWGWVAAIASDKGLRHTSLPEQTPERALDHLAAPLAKEQPEHRPGAFADLHRQLDEYLNGERQAFDVPLDLEGAAPFHRRAWEACASVPRGETRTYRWLAEEAGNVLASRAAGQAMAKNRVPLLIPCHRVVGSDGGLHGFAGPGIGMKSRLLELEAL